MAHWEFGETEADGLAWLAHPETLHAYVDFQPSDMEGGEAWFRIMVVTRRWVRRQVNEGMNWAAWPSLFIVDDGSPDQIRAIITEAVAAGSIKHWATRITDRTPSDL